MIPSVPGSQRRGSPVRPRFLYECTSHISCTREVRFILGQLPPFGIRQMRRLRKNQELVEGIYTEAGDQFQTDGQSHAAQIIHRLVEREASGVPEGSISSPELVLNNISC